MKLFYCNRSNFSYGFYYVTQKDSLCPEERTLKVEEENPTEGYNSVTKLANIKSTRYNTSASK